MTRFIGIASGKGGTGKTTTSINLALSLSNLGYETTIIDANLATPHVALSLGSPNLPITINNVIKGENKLHEATYEHPSGLKIIPASISLDSVNELNPKRLSNLLYNIEMGDFVILDMSSGLTTDVQPLLSILDELVVIANPEMSSVAETIKTIKLAENNNIKVHGIVLNKSTDDNVVSKENIEALTDKKVISEIPHHAHFHQAKK
ncbi:MAG: P-loop NTPase, partial [Nanoarchaeota archaeon]|nr:P-loop NTPase [Nanoarchaeota archaeon]